MKKILIVLALCVPLGACVTNSDGTVSLLPTINNPVSISDYASVAATYKIAQSGADVYIQRYRDGFRCTKTNLENVTNLCSRRSIVIALQSADRKAIIALGKARVFIINNPTLDASSLISAASSAVSAFYAIQQGNV